MDSNGSPLDKGFVFAPLPVLHETETYTPQGEVTVDGETFAMRRRDSDGSLHYDWLSGPNEGYGFSVSCGLDLRSQEQHISDIQEFLSEINPTTGYFYDH